MADQISKHEKSFQKRWNVGWDEATSFSNFKNRLFYLIDNHLSGVLSAPLLNRFAFYAGMQVPYPSGQMDNLAAQVKLRQSGLSDTVLANAISSAKNSVHLAWHLQCLSQVLGEVIESKPYQSTQDSIGNFFAGLRDILQASPSVNLRFSITKNGIVFYQAGAKLLDEKLVDDNIAWLQEYPVVLKAYEQALTIYLSGDKTKYRSLVDNLRVAIEQLLKTILGNNKSLENQSKELNDWLDKHGTQKQISNLFGQLLYGPFTILQNDVAKHGDQELLDCEYEYLIYLTGTFIRLLIQLHGSKP